MNRIYKVDNFFSMKEITEVFNAIVDSIIIAGKDNSDNGNGINKELGRYQVGDIASSFSKDFKDKLIKYISNLCNEDMRMRHAVYVEYNNKYGTPNLPPHYDGDDNDLIINFQLSANTSWDLGLGFDLYSLEDNSALIFNGNEHVHWRPHKVFQRNEYVKMIFFRFFNYTNKSDYSHIDYRVVKQNDPMYQEIIDFRNKLRKN